MINFPNQPIRPVEVNRSKRIAKKANTELTQEAPKTESTQLQPNLDRRQKRDRRQQAKKVPFDRRISADRRKPHLDIKV